MSEVQSGRVGDESSELMNELWAVTTYYHMPQLLPLHLALDISLISVCSVD